MERIATLIRTSLQLSGTVSLLVVWIHAGISFKHNEAIFKIM